MSRLASYFLDFSRKKGSIQNFVWNRFLINEIDAFQTKESKKKVFLSHLLWLSRMGVWGKPLFHLERAVSLTNFCIEPKKEELICGVGSDIMKQRRQRRRSMNGQRRKALGKRARERVLEWLYPRAACCLCCGDPRLAEEEDCLCGECRGKLKERRVPVQACSRCLSPVEKGKPCAFCASPVMKPIDKVYAPYVYAGEVRRLIHQLKFNACGEAAPILGKAMAEALGDREFDCAAPVPLHPRRLRERGFNQSLLLCREIEKITGIPVREVLRRERYHKPQSKTPQSRRAENVSRAFSCPEGAEGLRVLLVDDVRTSGSTAHACAKALINAGAESVCLCTAAVVYRKKKANDGDG